MAAFNTVRFRVKPGRDREFLQAHQKIAEAWPGLRHANIIKTGERSYCIIAEWNDIDACIAARPNMIATLETFRDTLEDLGGGLGVTDPGGRTGGPGVEIALLWHTGINIGAGRIKMTRLFVDCREYPSDMNCSVAISADTKDELVNAAVQHAVAVHGHHDTPELRQELAKMIKSQ